MDKQRVVLGGIEAGGTTFAVSIAHGSPTNVVKQYVVPTTTPEETLKKVAELLVSHKVACVGVGCFGPIDLKLTSKTYGFITSTPKVKWQNTNVLGMLTNYGLSVPFGFNTDVNAAAMAEAKFGQHGNITSCAYTTVGTGIGVGVVTHSRCVSGLVHPEGGHIRVRRHAADTYIGNCPFHGDCLEGLANAEACAVRAGVPASQLHTISNEHIMWDIIAYYLAQLCTTITLLISPEIIVLGGGVCKRDILFIKIRKLCQEQLNGYICDDKIVKNIDTYIVSSRFNQKGSNTTSGAVGALLLGEQALLSNTRNVSKL